MTQKPVLYDQRDIYITPDGNRYLIDKKQRTTEGGIDYVYTLKKEKEDT